MCEMLEDSAWVRQLEWMKHSVCSLGLSQSSILVKELLMLMGMEFLSACLSVYFTKPGAWEGQKEASETLGPELQRISSHSGR